MSDHKHNRARMRLPHGLTGCDADPAPCRDAIGSPLDKSPNRFETIRSVSHPMNGALPARQYQDATGCGAEHRITSSAWSDLIAGAVRRRVRRWRRLSSMRRKKPYGDLKNRLGQRPLPSWGGLR